MPSKLKLRKLQEKEGDTADCRTALENVPRICYLCTRILMELVGQFFGQALEKASEKGIIYIEGSGSIYATSTVSLVFDDGHEVSSVAVSRKSCMLNLLHQIIANLDSKFQESPVAARVGMALVYSMVDASGIA